MFKRVLFLVVTLCVAAFAAQALAQEVMFAYSFEAGSSNRYSVKLSQQVDFGGNEMGQFADLEVTVKCVSVNEGSAVMEMTFDKADISRSMLGNQMSDPVAEVLATKALTFSVSPTGEVTDIKQSGYYDGWEQMRVFVEPVVKAWYVRLPGKKYAPGAEWNQKNTEKGSDGADVAMDIKYKYKENKKQGNRDCAVVTGDVATEVSGQSTTPMGPYKVAGHGKGKAEFMFDTAKTEIAKLKSKMSIDMDLTPVSGGDTTKANISYELQRELL